MQGPFDPQYLSSPIVGARGARSRGENGGRASWPLLLALAFVVGCQGEVDPPGSPGPVGDPSGSGGLGSSGAPAMPPAPGGSGSPGAGGSAALPGGGNTATPGAGTSAVGGTSAQGGSVAALDCTQPAAPRAPLRRITRFEYNNTVRDLLDLKTRHADTLPGEEAGSGFGNDADALGVSRLLTDGYRSVAKQFAQEATVDAAAVVRVAGCDPATGEDACQQRFLADYLGRAFRRPAEPDEVTSYQSTFTQGKMLGGTFATGVRAVLERSLQSAQFLYRIETGEMVDVARNLGRPTGYEIASRLSYLIWSSMPDKALLEAAQQGKLATKEGVVAEARRLLGDGRAKDGLRYFHGMLLGHSGLDNLERDMQLYPSFKPGMGSLFRQETEQFLDYAVWEGGGDLSTIFTAPYTFVNGPLATFYGIPNVTGDAFKKVDLVDTTKRLGLMTQASILTLTTPGSRTDPVVRGKWIYTKVLCGKVPDPPPDVPLLPEAEPGQSVRVRLAMHRDNPNCAGCHMLMDPIGFGFENYDGVGQWRDLENGVPIDNSGNVIATDVAGPFNGPVEFAQKLAVSRDVRSCYVGRYLNYAYGRALDPKDECSKSVATTAFEQAQGNVKELMIAVTQTDGFLLRELSAPVQ